jgi:hypothetical protein
VWPHRLGRSGDQQVGTVVAEGGRELSPAAGDGQIHRQQPLRVQVQQAFQPGRQLLSSDIRFWSSGDTKTGPVDGLLMEALWRPLDRCFIGGCRVVVGGGGINAA